MQGQMAEALGTEEPADFGADPSEVLAGPRIHSSRHRLKLVPDAARCFVDLKSGRAAAVLARVVDPGPDPRMAIVAERPA
jgi:hypothetical protein